MDKAGNYIIVLSVHDNGDGENKIQTEGGIVILVVGRMEEEDSGEGG